MGKSYNNVEEQLAAQAIGGEVVRYLKRDEVFKKALAEAESGAMRALEDIRQVLEDDKLEDPECFRRIEAIVNALEAQGIFCTRHDW